jgi:hypothetical protein
MSLNLNATHGEAPANNGMQPTAYSVRSCLAPAFSRA